MRWSSIPMKMKRCRVYPSVLSIRTRKNLIAVSPSVKLPGKDAVKRNSGGIKRAPRQERPLDQLLVSAGVSALVGQSPLPQHERISKSRLTQSVVTTRRAAVTGTHVCLEQQWIPVCLGCAQFGYELCAFPVRDLAIVQ